MPTTRIASEADGQTTVPTAEPIHRTREIAIKRLLTNRDVEAFLTVIGFAILFGIYGIWLGKTFLNVDARLLDVHQNIPILMLGLAVLVTLVAGLFDLSVAGMATLTTFLTIGFTTNEEWPFPLVLVACLAIGVAGGLINGLLVEVLRVNTFIATLGTGSLFVGFSSVYSDGTQVTVEAGRPNVPTWFSDMGAFGQKCPAWILVVAAVLAGASAFLALERLKPASWSRRAWLPARACIVAAGTLILVFALDLPKWITGSSWLVALLLLAGLLLWVLIQYTTYGRYLRAIGANRVAARLAGINVEREVMKAFMIGGFLAALAGVFLAASQGSASPDIAGSFLLPAFAAAFLSTVVFSTGHFTVWGTILGGIFLAWVSVGLIIGGLPATWTSVVNGIVLVFAVALSTVMRRRR